MKLGTTLSLLMRKSSAVRRKSRNLPQKEAGDVNAGAEHQEERPQETDGLVDRPGAAIWQRHTRQHNPVHIAIAKHDVDCHALDLGAQHWTPIRKKHVFFQELVMCDLDFGFSIGKCMYQLRERSKIGDLAQHVFFLNI